MQKSHIFKNRRKVPFVVTRHIFAPRFTTHTTESIPTATIYVTLIVCSLFHRRGSKMMEQPWYSCQTSTIRHIIKLWKYWIWQQKFLKSGKHWRMTPLYIPFETWAMGTVSDTGTWPHLPLYSVGHIRIWTHCACDYGHVDRSRLPPGK